MTEKHLTFTAKGPGLRVDLERLIPSRMLVEANSGGGKSHGIRQLLEETHGRVQHLVIDPEGEFASLRERFDYVLVAAKGGDVVASVKTAAMLCRRLMEIGASAVIDLYELPKHERREFVRRFLTELMALPRDLWRPVLVVLDEAHDFCPEKGHGESVATEAVISLCSQGRKRGYCAVLATQRISKLSKDAAAELNNKLIGRTGLDVDVKRAGDELGLDKEGRAQLPHLEPGDFFAYGPAISRTVARVRTGEVKTRPPKLGHLTDAPPPPPAKVKALLAQLVDLPQEAEERERSIEALEREVRTLKAELTKAKKAQPPAPAPAKPVEIPVLTNADLLAIQGVAEGIRTEFTQLGGQVGAVEEALKEIVAKLTAICHPPASREVSAGHRVYPSGQAAMATKVVPISRAAPTPRAEAAGDVKLKAGAVEMLKALALRRPEPLTKDQIGTLTGFTPTGGTFREYLRMLLRAGYVTESGDVVTLTDEGMNFLGADLPERPATTEQLVALWRGRFKAGAAKMLDVLVAEYPKWVDPVALGETTGFAASGGTFREYLRMLRRARLLQEEGGQVRATPALFLDGLGHAAQG